MWASNCCLKRCIFCGCKYKVFAGMCAGALNWEICEMATTTKNWYVLRVASNREDQVRDALERKVKIEGLADLIGRILVPTERIKRVKQGQQKVAERKLYPGYVFVEMEVNNDGTIPERSYYLFKDTQ